MIYDIWPNENGIFWNKWYFDESDLKKKKKKNVRAGVL